MDPIKPFTNGFGLDCYGQDSGRLSIDYTQSNASQPNLVSPHLMTSRSSSDLDLRPMTEQIHQNGFRWNSTSNLTQRSREEEKTPIKRTKDIILEHLSAKRPRTSDPFESPNPRIKDFRLIGASNDAKDSYNCDPFFCRFCKVSALNLKELAEHLRGKRHQKNSKSRDLSEDIHRSKSCDSNSDLLRVLSRMNGSFVGLEQIRPHMEDKTKYYCLLCDCNRMSANNIIQHIKGSKHKRKVMSSKTSESNRNVGSTACHSRKSNSSEALPQVLSRSAIVSPRRTRTSLSKWDSKQVLNRTESKSETNIKKTIENFKTIRNICDQMIEFYSEREKPSLIGAVSDSTSAETEPLMQIKKEK